MTDGATAPGDAEQGASAIENFLDALDLQAVEPPETAGSSATAGPIALVSLSEREVDVLRLIAAGRSNAQIAEALVISPNTVARHVSNIFDKTGAANRAEATAYALRNGLA
jgi:DNA-binding NarL/FixJ family response regulator